MKHKLMAHQSPKSPTAALKTAFGVLERLVSHQFNTLGNFESPQVADNFVATHKIVYYPFQIRFSYDKDSHNFQY